MPNRRLRLPWILGAFAVAQGLGWGMTFNLPAITGSSMAHALGIPYALVMVGPTAMLLVMAITALPFARLFERRGARVVMTGGVIVGMVGLVVIALSTAPWSYFLGWTVVGVSGAASLTTAIQIGLAELTGPQAKRAIGGLLVFGGLSTTICWPLLGVLQSSLGWRLATLIGAATMLVVNAPIYWWLLAKRPKEPDAQGEFEPLPSLDRTSFALLALSTAANGLVTWGFSLTMISLFEDRGISHSEAVFLGSLVGVGQFVARLFHFAGGRRWKELTMGLAAGVALSLSFGLMIGFTGVPAATLFVVVYGLAAGALAVARSTFLWTCFLRPPTPEPPPGSLFLSICRLPPHPPSLLAFSRGQG